MKDPSAYRKALGQAIVNWRTNLGLSREKLARITGIDLDRMTAVEDGETDANLSEMQCIATALGIAPSTMLTSAESLLHS